MKRILLLFSLMAASNGVFAQSQDGYTLGGTSGHVDCYYRLSTCNGKTVVLLRFDNKNTSPVTLAWKESFTTRQVPKKMPGYRNMQVTLAPGISEALNCEDLSRKDYIVGEEDVSATYRAEITNFQFGEISTKPAN